MSQETPIRILVAEDEQHLGAILEHFLNSRGYAVTMCRNGAAAMRELRSGAFDVALVDIVMPELDGFEVLRQLQQEIDPPEVITITGNGTIDTAITAIKLGAYDYIAKPYRMAEIDVMVRRAWEKRELLRANRLLNRRLSEPLTIDAEDARMRDVLNRLVGAAASAEPVLLRGEAGTGKSVLARYLHHCSGRPRDVYVEVDRRGDVDNMLEYLFGTAAAMDRGGVPGVLQTAERGTVVVDLWILHAAERAALLDAVRAGEFRRVDGATAVPLNARLVLCDRPGIARDAVPGVSLEIPPLRERIDDVALLAASVLQQLDERQWRDAPADVAQALRAYSWPGNVRELAAVLTRALSLAQGSPIAAMHVARALGAAEPDEGSASAAPVAGALAELERAHIEAMLVREQWHQGRAAQALGISTKTLYRKMREYGFTRPRKRKLARPATTASIAAGVANAG